MPELEEQKQRPNRSQIEHNCRQLHPHQLRLRRRRPGAGQTKGPGGEQFPGRSVRGPELRRGDAVVRRVAETLELRVGGTGLIGVQSGLVNARLPSIPGQVVREGRR